MTQEEKVEVDKELIKQKQTRYMSYISILLLAIIVLAMFVFPERTAKISSVLMILIPTIGSLPLTYFGGQAALSLKK